MSSISMGQGIPGVIASRIRAMRRKLSGWLLVRGFSQVLLVLLALVLLDAVIDRYFKMDTAQRTIMLVVMVAILFGFVYWRLVRPFLAKVSDDALILQVEKTYSHLKESLISSVQFAREGIGVKQGVSDDMVQATIRQGIDTASSLDFTKSLHVSRFVVYCLLLIVGLCGLAGLAYGVSSTEFWRIWFNRNVLLTEDTWPQNTYLIVDGVNDGAVVMKRGEDHLQRVFVDMERSSITDVEVTIETDHTAGRGPQKMQRQGAYEHHFEFRNLSNPFRFRVRGGDHVSAWISATLVDPPTVAELELSATLPAYANSQVEKFPSGAGPHAVLSGSSLSIKAITNKPVKSAFLRHEGGETLPLQIEGETQLAVTIPAEAVSGGKYTFDLIDTNDMTSSRPSSFQVRIKPDRAPQVRATLQGVSGIVVPKAIVPVSFTVLDEFAITTVDYYLYWLGDSADSVRQELTTPIAEVANQLGGHEVKALTRYDLRPLNLPEGVGLRIKILATDNNLQTGPGIGESREFLLRVVSEQELRSDLLRREIEQRQAFEFAYKNQEQLMVDLRALAAAQLERSDPEAATAKVLEMQRRQKILGTNLVGIADRFETFVEEARNNRLDETVTEVDGQRSIERRLIEQIIGPIRDLDENEIFGASQSFESVRRSATDPEPFAQAARETAQVQEIILTKMQAILAAMEDSETYQQIINQAIIVKRDQEDLRRQAEKRRQQGVEDIFDNIDDLFDDDDAEHDKQDETKEGDGKQEK